MNHRELPFLVIYLGTRPPPIASQTHPQTIDPSQVYGLVGLGSDQVKKQSRLSV